MTYAKNKVVLPVRHIWNSDDMRNSDFREITTSHICRCFFEKKNFKWYFNKIIASFILFATLSSGHMPVHFTSPHHKIRFNSQVLIHYCARYFTVVDDFIKQFLCREGLGKVFLVQQTYKITTKWTKSYKCRGIY